MLTASVITLIRSARLRDARAITAAATIGLTVIAFLGGALVLGLDLWPGFLSSRAHRLVSATPLLAVAIGYLVLQIHLRPRPHELLKRALLGLAFIFWSASQLAPAARWAPVANDLAIALFVLDLGLIIWDELEAQKTTENSSTSGTYHRENRLIALQPCPCCGGLTCAGRRLN
jgi:hypothetical protein